MKDRRTVKTKRAIRSAFIALLQEKPLNKITVSEISERADLGRGTFYLHYKDVYDLYEQMEDELYTGLGSIFDASYPENERIDIKTLTQTLLEYVSANKDVFSLFALSEGYGKLLHKLRILFCDKILQYDRQDTVPEQQKADIMFAVSGVIGVMEEWLAGDLKISQEQLALLLHENLIKL